MKLRKAIAVLLVIIFALIALPALFLRSVASTYLSSDFYSGKIVDQSYEYVVEFIADGVSKEKNIGAYFTKEDILDLIKKYVSVELIHDFANDFNGQIKGINEGRRNDGIVISLAPIKGKMDLIAGDISKKIVEAVPTCEIGLDDKPVDLEYVEGKPNCIPDGFDKSQIIQSIRHEVENELNDTIPGEFRVELSGKNSPSATLKQILSFIDYLQVILPLIMIVFLLIVALLLYSPYSLVTKFVGGAMMLAGLFGLGGAQFLRQVPFLSVSQSNFPDLVVEEISYIRELYGFFVSFVVERMMVYSSYLLGIGIVVVLFGFYLHHFHEYTGEY